MIGVQAIVGRHSRGGQYWGGEGESHERSEDGRELHPGRDLRVLVSGETDQVGFPLRDG